MCNSGWRGGDLQSLLLDFPLDEVQRFEDRPTRDVSGGITISVHPSQACVVAALEGLAPADVAIVGVAPAADRRR